MDSDTEYDLTHFDRCLKLGRIIMSHMKHILMCNTLENFDIYLTVFCR